MKPAKTRIPADVRAILDRAAINERMLVLPEQLDRETYLRVAKALIAAGGKWDRKAKGHVFPFDPRELMADVIETGEVVDLKKTLQFFETPDALAQRMVDLCGIGPGQRALEPSAGRGRIVRHLLARGAIVDAVEIDAENCKALCAIEGDLTVCQESFEAYAAANAPLFDTVVMNPPFANNQDIQHIRAAWDLVRSPGRLIAICSEGPFFRQDRAAVEFRAWLAEIGADAVKLPDQSFHESGTDVATRLIFATKVAAPARAEAPETMVRNIPMDQVAADPGQPRKIFEPTALRELAASIQADGLLQPITVRAVGPASYQIVAGERRWRAHQLNGAATIRAIVIETTDQADIRIKQIIENDQRVDVSPLEQARSYQALMDEAGWTVEQLAARIGKAPHRITERTDLLKIMPEYQQLLASGNLKPSEATELARLGPRGQATLFKAIRSGACKTYNDLRAMATALVQAEAQLTLMPDAPPPPSEEDRRLANGFEAQVDRIAAMLRTGIHENQVVAVRKTNPDRASYLADLFAQMQKDLRRIEIALREAAIQESFLAA
jgi:ParB/RepB/Spo0J family partition protein